MHVVFVDGVKAHVVSVSTTTIVFTAPAHAAGNVDIAFYRPFDSAANVIPAGLQYADSVPTLSPAALALLAAGIFVVAAFALRR
jgi:hypothetical protein